LINIWKNYSYSSFGIKANPNIIEINIFYLNKQARYKLLF